VNNYLRGKAPFPFDLLYWNSDATRMPAANHSFYLRNCYLNNALAKGEMVIGGKRLDLKQIKLPVYNLATREDHIAPAKSVLLGSTLFGGDVKYVLAGSGHIAGVVNPPDKKKYQYWTDAQPTNGHAPETVEARTPGDGKLKPIEDAPGSYVKEHA
jgi:polyhydroxyalkanoate synthase